MAVDNVIAPDRDLVDEAKTLRVEVLNSALLFAVVVGGLAFARTVIDAMDLQEWRIVGGAVLLYGGLIVLLVARRGKVVLRL